MTKNNEKVLEQYKLIQESIVLNVNAIKSLTPQMLTLLDLSKRGFYKEVNEILDKTTDAISEMADQNAKLLQLSKEIVEDYLKDRRYDNN